MPPLLQEFFFRGFWNALQCHTSQQNKKKIFWKHCSQHPPPAKNKKVLLNNKKSPMMYSYIFFRNSTSYSNNIHHLSNGWFRNLTSITSKFFPWIFHKFFMRFLQNIFRKIFKKSSGESEAFWADYVLPNLLLGAIKRWQVVYEKKGQLLLGNEWSLGWLE